MPARNIEEALNAKVSDFELVNPDDILRTIDKFDKVGAEGVVELLTTGRIDQSGAFIDGLGLSRKDASRVVRFMECRGRDNTETLHGLPETVISVTFQLQLLSMLLHPVFIPVQESEYGM